VDIFDLICLYFLSKHWNRTSIANPSLFLPLERRGFIRYISKSSHAETE
jgi:hypothetical protein